MRVIHAFATLFVVMAFLTLGSLFLMVALHLLSAQDAIAKVQEIYSDPWKSFQTGIVGLIFIFAGLTFAKWLVKGNRQTEALILRGETGPIVVYLSALEDLVKKVLKHFSLVKEWKAKVLLDGKDVEVKLRLVLWSGGDVPALLNSIQQEITERFRKVLGSESRIEISCDIVRIEESQIDVEEEGAITV